MTRQRINASRATPPEASDDLKRIHGIGPNIERRLHSAGICTFASLATLSAETVAALIPNLSAKQITKQDWILQARKLVTNQARSSAPAKESVISASRQHYHNFTVEFLLDEKNKTRRIRVVHVQSGDVDTWANWDAERLFDFLARHTGAHLSYPKSAILTPTKLIPKPANSTEQPAERSAATTSAQPIHTSKEDSDLAAPNEIPELSPQPLASSDHLPIRTVPQFSPPAPAAPIDKIRLLEWKTFIGKTNQLSHNIPRGQTFDVNLTLDLTSAALPGTSRLDFTGVLYAKKLGNGHRQVIGETQTTIPYASTVDLTIANSSLPQGLYRLEVLLTLIPTDPSLSTQSSILRSFQGGLFQVY